MQLNTAQRRAGQNMKNSFLLILFFAFGLLATPFLGVAATPEEIRAQIQNELGDRHPESSSAFWTGLGTEAVPVILQMLKEKPGGYAQARLIEGLGYSRTAESEQYLKSEIQSTGNAILKKVMLSSLIQSQGNDADDFALSYLKDKDPHIRLEVARAYQKYAHRSVDLKQVEQGDAKPWLKAEVKKLESEQNSKGESQKSKPILNKRVRAGAQKPVLEPLKDTSLVGEWNGTWVGSASGSAKLKLQLVDPRATVSAQKWKLEISFSKNVKPPKGLLNEFDLYSFQTQQSMWIEIRFSKDDLVFIAQRPLTP